MIERAMEEIENALYRSDIYDVYTLSEFCCFLRGYTIHHSPPAKWLAFEHWSAEELGNGWTGSWEHNILVHLAPLLRNKFFTVACKSQQNIDGLTKLRKLYDEFKNHLENDNGE
jgi:hypothetical protein